MAEISFTVPGILPGWQRAGKSGKRHFTQTQTAGAEAEVAAWGRQAACGRMLVGALGLLVTVWLPVPASWSAKRKAPACGGYVTTKPDFDNLAKLVGDALNGVCYADDAAIADGRVVKRYAGVEGARADVRVWELGAASRYDGIPDMTRIRWNDAA